MSAVTPTGDTRLMCRNVCFVPIAELLARIAVIGAVLPLWGSG